MFQNAIALPGATQFSAATPVATFLEHVSVTTRGPNVAPCILGYAYNSLGAAQTVTLRLAPAAGVGVDEQIALRTPTTTINAFTEMCGPEGIVVPRMFGLQNNGTTQVINVALGSAQNAAPMVLLFSTTGKTGDGTFRVWWTYREIR